MSAANLTVRFACELAVLAAVGWWGWQQSRVLGFLLPVLVAIGWGVAIAPKARRRLRDPARFALELIVFAAATAALVSVGHAAAAAIFAVAAVLSGALVRVWPEPGMP